MPPKKKIKKVTLKKSKSKKISSPSKKNLKKVVKRVEKNVGKMKKVKEEDTKAKKKTTKSSKPLEKIETPLEESKTEVVSVKRVVYAEIDDEVTEIYDRIKAVHAKHIYIVIPKRAILFQSIVNLRILKRKAEDDNKIIYFITNDKNGIYLAQRIGIQVFNKANSEGKPALYSTDSADEQLRITPLKASVNAVEEETPTRLKERKLSISEILRKKKEGKRLSISRMDKTSKTDKPKKKSRFVIVAPNRHALIGLVVFSVFILLVIVYIALPGVTIYLTPSASVLEKSVNITLADYAKNTAELDTHPFHMIASYPIETEVEKSVQHFATGKKFSEKGANATGKLTIYNTTNGPWPLVEQTRFQTNEGIVFRISDGVTVPAANSQEPGSLEVFVTADIKDANGLIVGSRGNIEPTKFFLPGLRDSSQSKIYAESFEPMTGGFTDYITYITEEDIEAAKSRLNDELLKNAIDDLEAEVVKKGDLVGDSDEFSLLQGDDSVKIGEVQIFVPDDLVGKEITEFAISGEVSVSGVYYDHDSMLQILVSELTLKKSPQKELLRVNEDSTSYRIFEWDEGAGKIKLTANIKGIEQFNIDPGNETGERLLRKIKEHIVGKDIEDAKQFIQNLPEVNKVEIDSWPAWSPTIPSIADNIEFEIREAIMVE